MQLGTWGTTVQHTQECFRRRTKSFSPKFGGSTCLAPGEKKCLFGEKGGISRGSPKPHARINFCRTLQIFEKKNKIKKNKTPRRRRRIWRHNIWIRPPRHSTAHHHRSVTQPHRGWPLVPNTVLRMDGGGPTAVWLGE